MLSADEIRRIYDRIRTGCARAGLSVSDGEDVAQEIWEWLLRTNKVELALRMSWVSGATQNFIRRYWKRAQLRNLHEAAWSRQAAVHRGRDFAQIVEGNEVLERLARALPDRERKLLILIHRGYTLQEAAEALGTPPGSRGYYGGRLVEVGRREIRRRSMLGRFAGAVETRSTLVTGQLRAGVRSRRSHPHW